MSKIELVEVKLEEHGFSFYVMDLPDEEVEDKLALASNETGLICRIEYQNFLFMEFIVNLERLFRFIAEQTGGEPEAQLALRNKVAAKVYEVNPLLNPKNVILTKSGVLKPKGQGEGTPLSDNSDWDRHVDDINPYVVVEEVEILDSPGAFIPTDNDEPIFSEKFDLETVKWKRLNIDLEIRKFSKDDLDFIFGNEISFEKEIHYKVHIIQQCIPKASSVFALCDATGLTNDVKVPELADELYRLCIGVNPFLKAEDIDLSQFRPTGPKKNTGRRSGKKSSSRKKKKGSGKRFEEITREELLTLAPRMKAKVIGQDEAIDKLVDTIQIASCGLRNPDLPVAVYLLCGTTGIGKCHGKGTKIRMFDGSVKNVEDVKPGELLMGDDSSSREVLSLARGQDDMFVITPKRGGEPFTCNKAHVLSLRNTLTKEIVNISVEDYLKSNKTFKHLYKLYRVGVEYPEKHVRVDPYFMGLWLGDGQSSRPGVTTMDPETVDYLYSYAAHLGLTINVNKHEDNQSNTYFLTSGQRGGTKCRNRLLNELRCYGLTEGNEKFLPSEFKINSREVRLQVLAGIIDSDGYLSSNCFDIVLRNTALVDDVVELSRSLGFQTTTGDKIVAGSTYRRITISGDTNEIPVRLNRKRAGVRKQKKDHTVTGFTVEYLGTGDYYGFTLDDNHLYLLNDFTVTHNTYTAKVLAEELCGSRDNIVRIDCSEYTQQHDVQKLIGAPPSYVGYEDGGFLTNAVQDNPFSIVLFDEIEKAHNKMFDLLLQIMDDARLTDGKGTVTDFKDCIVLMTSNIGVAEAEAISRTMGFGEAGLLDEEKKSEALKKALKARFRPEFLNRIDDTVRFSALSKEAALQVVALLLAKVKGYLEAQNIKAEFTNSVLNMIFDNGFSKKFGARPLQRTIDKEVIRPLAKFILQKDVRSGMMIKVDYTKDMLRVREVKPRLSRKKNKTTVTKV